MPKGSILVEITGWRYARLVWGNSVSRDQFVTWVRRFFTSRGVTPKVVKIAFRRTRKPKDRDGKAWGLASKELASVFPWGWSPMRPIDMAGVVAHELHHVVCRTSGIQSYPWKLPHDLRPEEIAASNIGKRWKKKGITK